MIPELRKSQKILAINFGGIGDEILFLPTLKKLRQLYPHSHITLMLEPRSASVRQITDVIDAVVTFDIKKRPLFINDLVSVVSLIRDGGYELVLSSGSSPLVSILLFLGGSDWRIGYDSGALAQGFLTHAVPLKREQYAGNMYYDLAHYLEDTDVGQAAVCLPEITIAPENMANMEDFLASAHATADDAGKKRTDTEGKDAAGKDAGGTPALPGGAAKKRILLHPGTSRLAVEKGIIKTWASANWVELIKLLQKQPDLEPILAGGPDDQSIIAEINAGLPPNTTLLSSVGKTKSLADLAALTKLCDLLVCVDSAPMHVAVGAGTPVVAMFVVTDEKKLLPTDAKFRAIRSGQDSGAGWAKSERKSGRDAGVTEPTQPWPGVQLRPDDVYRAVLDQLRV